MSDNPAVPPQSNSNAAGDDTLTPASLAPAYVFEATDPVDTDAVRNAMAQSAAVGEEVQAYRRLFNAMLHATPSVQPPPAVGEKVLRAIQPPVTPIAQRYPGAGAAANPLESMQVVPLITPPGGVSAVSASSSVNPLTGKPASASAAQPKQSQKPKATSAATAPPYVPPGATKASSRPKPPPQYATTKASTKKGQAVPAGFALTPIPPAGSLPPRRGGAAMWAAWGLAITALALLLASNSYWGSQNAQMQQANAQLQSDLRGAQQSETSAINDLTALQQQLAAKDSEISTLQSSLVSAEQTLSDIQAQLNTANAQIADSAAVDSSDGMTISDDMMDVLARGPMQQASLAALNTTQPVSATARILWNPEMERGMLVAMEMPPLPDGQAYQVWVLRAGVPTSAGMFTVDDKGMGMLELDGMNLTDYEVAAITTEPMTGSPSPTGAIVIAGEL